MSLFFSLWLLWDYNIIWSIYGQLREHNRVLVGTEEKPMPWESEDLGSLLGPATKQLSDSERYRPGTMPKVPGMTSWAG